MQPKIQKLDPVTVNQIAAGEVIVNPASVVKELVDNSLDAQANKILIEVKGGGRQLIRVTDNGCGMCPEDAINCFELHATSKLQTIHDLEQLDTMGFRGEALASIAAVARVQLKTRPQEAAKGFLVKLEGGKVQSTAEVPCDYGTCIEIEELFYNIPARRKFMKAPKQDNLDVEKCLFELSLSHLSVEFILIVDGQKVLDLPADQTLKERARTHLKVDKDEWVAIDHVDGDLKLHGLLALPSVHRPNRTGHYLFLNKRPIQAWQLAQAITQGYGAALPEGRHPVFLLQMTLDGGEFDVNAHPQKREVRFRHEGELKDRIRKGVSLVMQKCYKPVSALPWDLPEAPVYHFSSPPVQVVHETVELPISYESIVEKIPEIIGTIPGYILLEENKGGLTLLDQRGAEARIAFEMHSSEGDSQLLGVPLQLDLDEEERAKFSENAALIDKKGFWIEEDGSGLIILKGAPRWALKDPEWAFRGLLDRKSHLVSKRGASGQKRLYREEAIVLMKQLIKCKEPMLCPFGKPLYAALERSVLEELFQ